MYQHGYNTGFGNPCFTSCCNPCFGGGFGSSSGSGSAIVLVLFILLVIVIGCRFIG